MTSPSRPVLPLGPPLHDLQGPAMMAGDRMRMLKRTQRMIAFCC